MSYQSINVTAFGLQTGTGLGDLKNTDSVPDILPGLYFKNNSRLLQNYLYLVIEVNPTIVEALDIRLVEILDDLKSKGYSNEKGYLEQNTSEIRAGGDKVFTKVIKLPDNRIYVDRFNLKYTLRATSAIGIKKDFNINIDVVPYYLHLDPRNGKWIDVYGNTIPYSSGDWKKWSSFFDIQSDIKSYYDNGSTVYGEIQNPIRAYEFIGQSNIINQDLFPLLFDPQINSVSTIYAVEGDSYGGKFTILGEKGVNFSSKSLGSIATYNTSLIQDYYQSANYGVLTSNSKSDVLHIRSILRHEIGTTLNASRSGDGGNYGGYYSPPWHVLDQSDFNTFMFWDDDFDYDTTDVDPCYDVVSGQAIKTCQDPTASNYFGTVNASTGYHPTVDPNSQVTPAIFNAFQANQCYSGWWFHHDSSVCQYSDADEDTGAGGQFVASFYIDEYPTESGCDGVLRLDANGGVHPYTFTLICAASDTGCTDQAGADTRSNTFSVVDGVITRTAGSDGTNDFTNMTDGTNGLASFGFNGMCGISPSSPDDLYILTISHAGTSGSVVMYIGADFQNTADDLTYNCKDATALNYINSNVSESSLCRFCDINTGHLNSGVAGNLSSLATRLSRSLSNDTPTAFYSKDDYVTNCSSTTGDNTYICASDGLGKITWYFKSATIQDETFGYAFDIINSSTEIDNTDSTQKWILKYRRYSQETYETYYENSNHATEYLSRVNLFDNAATNGLALTMVDHSDSTLSESDKLRTIEVSGANATTTTFSASGLDSKGEQWGWYIAKLAFVDTNEAHELEKCTYYTEPVKIQVPGCVDSTASNWHLSSFGISNYPVTFNDQFVVGKETECEFIDFENFTSNILDYMEFRVFYDSSQSGIDCAFDIKLQWTLTQSVPIGGLQAYAPGEVYGSGDFGWNTFGTANNAFFQLVKGIAALDIGFDYMHPNLSINAGDGVTKVRINAKTAAGNDSPTPYTPIDLQLNTAYAAGLFLLVDSQGQTNTAQAPVLSVTMGTSFETGVVGVGCVDANMTLGITYGELQKTIDIQFLDAPGILVSGQQFLNAGNVFPSDLGGTPFEIATQAGLCQNCSDLSNVQVQGCTDPLACNVNPEATVDDGSCVTDNLFGSIFELGTPGSGTLIQAGAGATVGDNTGQLGGVFNPCSFCTDSNASNWNASGAYYRTLYKSAYNLPDDELNAALLCTNTLPGICNSVDTNLCYYELAGCTDYTATNFNIEATVDDNSCVYDSTIPGCTDPDACNYNPNATGNDGSCSDVPDETLNCSEFDNWTITDVIQPSVCDGVTTDGSFILKNSTYSGAFYFKIENASDNGAFFTSDVVSTYYYVNGAGVTDLDNPYAVFAEGAAYGAGDSFINNASYPVANIVVAQDPSSGTSITVSGHSGGTFKIRMLYAINDNSHGNGFGTFYYKYNSCYCTNLLSEIQGNISSWTANSNITNNIYDNTQAVYVSPDGAWQSTGHDYPYFNLVIAASSGINRFTNVRTNINCGCCDPEASNYNEVVATTNPYGCTPTTCEFYGCTDPEASNYWPKANYACTDPETQEDCEPCIYGNVSVNSLYSPQFCMPKNLSAQIGIIKKCIATSGTNAYVNMITGQTECAYNDAWRLILIEYLLSRRGLDCLYNCKDAATPDLERQPSCDERATMGILIGSLGYLMSVGERRTFHVGMTLSYKPALETDARFFVLNYLPGNVGSITIKHPSEYGDDDTAAESAQHQNLTPDKWLGWYVCEEGPSKPTNLNYIDKFINFVQNYCRSCTVQEDIEELPSENYAPGVITINGMVITINNEDFQ
tara:strand:- start:3114 stop:8504 length:5391 start_codon:yes stop_codon:yes gene_type:complete